MNYNKAIPFNDLPALPPATETFDSSGLLKALVGASRHLAELKGLCVSLPDPNILINTVVLQESKDSSAIENIITTQDELYRGMAETENSTEEVKEVLLYREALYAGLMRMRAQRDLLTTNTFIEIADIINGSKQGIRSVPGTTLKNSVTGEVVYTPPCCGDVIREKLESLEVFINDGAFSDLDPLIKMSLIHYQFEAIHPFSDGNGRTGRILNALYLCQQGLLQEPVLYLSSYIVQHKAAYYQLLRGVTERGNWKDWVMYMITAVSETAQLTTYKIRKMLALKARMEQDLKGLMGSSYHPALLQLMFRHPYLKIEMLVKNELSHRQTASLWLRKIADHGLLKSRKFGRTTYFINHGLMDLLHTDSSSFSTGFSQGR